MKKSAFTLIELLVVIAIIAILAGIALPVFSKVQEKAHATQDASNIRQLGLGVIGYMNDNTDTYPALAGPWTKKLNPTYVPGWKVFLSPFDKRTSNENGDGTTPVSYDMNANLTTKAGGSGGPASSSDVVNPSSCILMAPNINDPVNINSAAVGWKGTALNPGQPSVLSMSSNGSGATGGTHAGGRHINVLFADAHVADMLMSDFHSTLPNSDTTSSITDVRWNK